MENNKDELLLKKMELKNEKENTIRVWMIVGSYIGLFVIMFIYAIKINR